MAAVVRLGTCSWADEGLIAAWYPRGVTSAAGRLRYYAERFDNVEVDSTYYALPHPETVARWVERTPPAFTFNVKASGEMTGHRPGPGRETAFALFRSALEPLEVSGKWLGVLLQDPPWFTKTAEAKEELIAAGALVEPLVPFVEFRHRSWLEEHERADTFAFLERHGLSYVSVDAPRTTASNVVPPIAMATHRVAYVRFHGRNATTWNIRGATSAARFDWDYTPEELAEWVEPLARLASSTDEVYGLFNNNNQDQAPRAAAILRRLLDEAGIPATGSSEPEPDAPTLF